jgi:hypothetical protein
MAQTQKQRRAQRQKPERKPEQERMQRLEWDPVPSSVHP